MFRRAKISVFPALAGVLTAVTTPQFPPLKFPAIPPANLRH
jgi:hypothetical protein